MKTPITVCHGRSAASNFRRVCYLALGAMTWSCLAASPAARADVIYTVTATGTITSGTDTAGFFGTPGANLTGDSFSITQTFDASLSGTSSDNGVSDAFSGAVLTIGAQSYTILANGQAENFFFINGGADGDFFAQTIASGGVTFIDVNANLNLASSDPSQVSTFSLSGTNSDFEFENPENVHGSVSTVTFNGGPIPAPEPSSLALLGGTLAGLAWLRGRKTA